MSGLRCVETVRRNCIACGAGELEVERDTALGPNGGPFTFRRRARCLACGLEYTTHWWPHEFEQALLSATYLAA